MVLKDLQHLFLWRASPWEGPGIYMHYTYQIKYKHVAFCPSMPISSSYCTGWTSPSNELGHGTHGTILSTLSLALSPKNLHHLKQCSSFQMPRLLTWAEFLKSLTKVIPPLSTLKQGWRFSKGTFLKGLRRRCRSKCLHLASFLLLAAGCLTDTKNLRRGGCY